MRKTQGKETDGRTRDKRSRRKEGGKNEEPRLDSESQRLLDRKKISELFRTLRSGTVGVKRKCKSLNRESKNT